MVPGLLGFGIYCWILLVLVGCCWHGPGDSAPALKRGLSKSSAALLDSCVVASPCPRVPLPLCPLLLFSSSSPLLFFSSPLLSSSSSSSSSHLLSHASPGPSPDPVVNVSPLRRVARIGRYGYSLTFSDVSLHPRPYFSIHRIHRNLPLHCIEQKNAFTLDLFPEATSVNSTQRRASFIGFRTRHQGMSVDAGSACPTRGLQRVAREACEFAASNSSLAPLAPWR